ncbi:MAG: hypothetical protein HC882_00295 [Acidobacteria bacterium]|nr:hypothetical protein [Acidobacteriota bacterium]
MLAGLALLAGVAYLASGGSRGRHRRLGDPPLLPSGDPPSGSDGVPSGAPEELWPVKPEDFVHPAKRLEVRRRAEATGGRWALIGRDGAVYGRFKTRADVFQALQRAGYGKPKPPKGEALTVAESEGWQR